MSNSDTQQPARPPEKPTLSWPQSSAPATPSSVVNAKPAPKNGAPAARYSTTSLAGAALGGLIIGMLLMFGLQRLPSNGTSDGALEKTPDGKTGQTSSASSGSATKAVAPAGSTAGYSGDSFTLTSVQSAGYSVSVSSISVSAPTWAVVYDNNNGMPGNALGAALFTPEKGSGIIRLLRATESGKKYFVGLQTDDGDRTFSLHGDAQVIDPDGRSVLASFVVQ